MTTSPLPTSSLIDTKEPMSGHPLKFMKNTSHLSGDQDVDQLFQDSLFTFEALQSGDKIPKDLEQFPLDSSKMILPSPVSTSPALEEEQGAILEEVMPIEFLDETFNPLMKEKKQPEALVFKEKGQITSLETVESILDEDVSVMALSYAMGLQEKEISQGHPNQIFKANVNKEDFSELQSSVALEENQPVVKTMKEAIQVPSNEIVPSGEQKEEIVALLQESPEGEKVKTALSSENKPFPQIKKIKDSSLSQTGVSTDKESLSSLRLPAESRHNHSQGEGEDLNSEDFAEGLSQKTTKAPNSLEGKPSFSESILKTSSSPSGSSQLQTTLLSLQDAGMDRIDQKESEEAFHRGSASLDTKSALTQSTQQHSSHSSVSQNASIQEQIAFSIKNNAAKGKSEINLHLRPNSLGRLNIKIDINKEGQTFVVVTAERTETKELLQQDSRHLMSLLEKSDLDISDDNMFYNLFQEGDQRQFEQKQEDSVERLNNQPTEHNEADMATASLAPLEMREIHVPRHGGTWQAIA